MWSRSIAAIVAPVVLAAAAAGAATPAQNCQTAKNKTAGKYAYCRQKAEARYATTGNAAARTAALQKCLDRYTAKWSGLEQKAVAAGGICPSVDDQASIQGAVDDHTDDVAARLAGGAPGGCPGELTTCNDDLTTCQADLATCQATPQGQRLKTGQTSCWDSAGDVVACAGTGQDGELQEGLVRAYVDNGDGTITDTKTGLMWEKLSDDGSIHDQDTTYTWANAFAVKIAALNAGTGFAGHADWRLPNVNELQSLVNYGASFPALDPEFNTACAPGCTVLTCSCAYSTVGSPFFWSSTSIQDFPGYAFGVLFHLGVVDGQGKDPGNVSYVRAVRGGS